jgi:hypothetical protein
MAGTWTSERFPQFESAIRQLAEQHRELEDEPLHLAFAYLPRRNGQEVTQGIFLFEVIGGSADSFGQDDLFETTFEATPGLSSGLEQTLHLILATPRELEKALDSSWPLAVEIADAVRRKDYKVLHADAQGKRLLRKIRAIANSSQGSARG